MKKTKNNLQQRTCLILDASYSPYTEEDLDSNIETPFAEYGDAVVLLLQDIETSNVFHCPLSASDIKELVSLENEPTPRQLIKFAEALRHREDPISLLVSSENNIITPEMIQQLGLLKDKKTLDKFEQAKKKQKELLEEQQNISETEYDEFMKTQDQQLKEKFALWKQEKEQASKQAIFLDLENIEE